MTRDAIAWVTRESVGPRSTIAWEPIYPPSEKPRRVCAKKGCRRLVSPMPTGGKRIYCIPEHRPRQPTTHSRRVCARKGCRRWWLPTDMKRESRRIYCTPAHRLSIAELAARETERKRHDSRTRVRVREVKAAIKWDRIGDSRTDDEPMRCVKCLGRRARKGFTFCLPCSTCQRCGNAPPRSRVMDCDRCCARAATAVRKRLADPVIRAKKNAAARKRYVPDAEDAARRRKRYAIDPDFRARALARAAKLWATDPAYRNRHRAVSRRYAAKRYATPAYRQRRATPAYRAKHNAANRKYQANMTPAQCERKRERDRDAKRRQRADPATRERHNAVDRERYAAKRAAAFVRAA